MTRVFSPAGVAAASIRLCPVAVLLLIAAVTVRGAQQSTPGAHVEVAAKPTIAFPGQPVSISGSTGSYGKKNQATVTVRHESGAPAATLTATVSSDGKFTVNFTDTTKVGKYKVSVTAPDGTGKGQTEFRVDSVAVLAEEVERVATDLDKRTRQLLAYVRTTMASLPPSAERDAVRAKLDDIDQKMHTVDLPPVKILGILRRIVQGPTVVYLPDQQIFGELRDWVPQGEEAIDTIDRARIGEKPAPICETIHTALEGAKFAGYAFAVTDKLLITLAKVGMDKGIPAFAKHVMGEGSPEPAYGLSSSLKTAAEKLKEEASIFELINTLILDTVELIVDKVFEHYCSEFKGPVSAKMTMEWREGIQPWLRYGVVLDGQFRLRYPKDAPTGKPVYMTGEFEGNATNFTFWEDVTVVQPLPKTLLVALRQWLPPTPFVNTTKSPIDFGQIARQVTPAYFDVPVVAEMTGDTIKMQFKDARHDFLDAVKNRLLFVVVGIVPDFKVFSFPIQKAHWILSKGLDDPAILNVTAGADGHVIDVTKRTHKDSPNKSVLVDWVITIKAKGAVEKEGR
jgi:hypothetical protein